METMEAQLNYWITSNILNRGDSPRKRIQLTYEEIEDAPEELLKELNITDTDRQEYLIEYLIAHAGGVLSLDKIMMQLFVRTKEVPRRNTITSRLYRMAGKGMIYNVPGKKGVYSTYELSEQEAKKMFGQLDGEAEETMQPQASVLSTASPPPAPVGEHIASSSEKIRNKFMTSS